MDGTISAEEFQRFQTQLLSLREAEILANDSKRRAESRVKELEEQLAKLLKSKSSNKQDQISELVTENKALRDKLQSTESSFQLQTSTLRAECHHLITELSRLQELCNKAVENRATQTDMPPQDKITQTDGLPNSTSLSDVAKLKADLEISHTTQDAYQTALRVLSEKISHLEADVIKIQNQNGSRLKNLEQERNELITRLNEMELSLSTTLEAKASLQCQLDSTRKKGEKVNRELRKQLSRFIKNHHVDVERHSLRKSPSSSTSSISSVYPNGSLSSNPDSAMVKTPTQESSEQIPSGYFPADDFQALINRMSEVQEDNCSLRRQIQRLQDQLQSASLTSHHTSESSGSSLFSLLKLPNFSSTTTSPDAVTLDRLKHMCEDLIKQNIEMSGELERLRGDAK